MKEQLRPAEGVSESQELKQEIHRMQVFLGQLARTKESLIIEMQRSVERRGAQILKKPATTGQNGTATLVAQRKVLGKGMCALMRII